MSDEVSVIPLAEETVTVSKVAVERSRLRVTIGAVTEQQSIATELLSTEGVVERIAADEMVDQPPAPEEVDGVLTIPLFEEVVTLQRRYRIVERIIVRRRERLETVNLPVTLHRQTATVERLQPSPAPPLPTEETMMRQITAVYDSMRSAQAAADDLAGAGIPRGQISIFDEEAARGTTTPALAEEQAGFFGALRNLFVADEDRYGYEESLRRGGVLLSVQVDDSEADRVIQLLDDSGAVDLDAREAEWRGAGATLDTGVASPALDVTGTAMPPPGSTTSADLGYGSTGSDTSLGTASVGTASSSLRATGEEQEQRIPIVEEQLQISKRERDRGSVRVRSYIVETPVREQVTLRDERVIVERRPTDQPLSAVGEDAFRERSFELRETSEEAVVEKTARVKEELVIRKQLDERTQTIADEVRRTEVEVDDQRTERAADVDPLQPGTRRERV